MSRRQMSLIPLSAALLLLVGVPMRAPGADEEKPTKAAGLVFDKKGNESITIKADGDDAPLKYSIPKDADKALLDSLKPVFGANRASFTFKKDGENRILVSIKRQVLKVQGTITGKVVGVHGDFWIELKPKDGVSDGFAPGGDTWNNPEFKAWRSSLKPGDSVTLSYTTDGERHRIINKTYKTNPPDNK